MDLDGGYAMNVIRRWIASIAIVTACLSQIEANAASVVGTIGFNVQGNISGANPDLSKAASFANIRTNNSATDDWTSFTSSHNAGGILAANVLSVGDFDSTGSSISFSSADFGSFTGKVVDDQMQSFNLGIFRSSTRSLKVVGLFTPGLVLVQQGYSDVVRAQLSIFFQGFTGQRSSLTPSARSGTVVMGTQPVPEPATCALVIIGATAYAGIHLRSRRRRG
jgi:hypothetical protein